MMEREARMERIIAKPLQWNRGSPSAKLRWAAMREATRISPVAETGRPMEDGAAALLRAGVDPAATVTLRHEGAAHDSFKPVPIAKAARGAVRRAQTFQRMEERRQAGRTPSESTRGEALAA